MDIKPDKAINNNLTARDVKYQGYNINRDSNNIKNAAFTATYVNNNCNKSHEIKDPKILKQDIETSYRNLDHPSKTSVPSMNRKVALTIFHQNIRGLHNKIEELLNCWSTEFPHFLCFTDHHLRDY